MKNLFHFDLQSQKPTSVVRCNSRSLKRFWIKGFVCLSLSCLMLLGSCGMLNQEQTGRATAVANAVDPTSVFYQQSFLQDQNWFTKGLYYAICGGTPPWAMGGGGKPQPTQSTQSCKQNGSPCLSGGECCSGNCDNNTSKCTDGPP